MSVAEHASVDPSLAGTGTIERSVVGRGAADSCTPLPTVTLAARLRRLSLAVRGEVDTVNLPLLIGQLVLSMLPIQVGARLRVRVLRLAGVSIGRGTVLLGPVNFTGPRCSASNVTIGEHCVVNFGCVLEGAAPITIGNRVGVGQEVMVLTNGHGIDGREQRMGILHPRPVRIGDGAWISSRALILPGVEVGPGSVVAAGAVVTRSVPPNVLVAGVPARVVRELP